MVDTSARILLVDDSRVNRLVAGTKLKDAGFQVTEAENGIQALNLLGLGNDATEAAGPETPFDAVILDVMMPGIDGMEVLRVIRKNWSSIQLPVVMATAKDRPEDVVAALKIGANDYITKPLNLVVLLARLQTHIEIKHSHEALRKAQQSLVSAARIESTCLLAAGVAHEIRNPLAQIQMAAGGFDGLICELKEESQKIADFTIQTIRKAVNNADEVVRKLIKAAEATRLVMTPADINETARYIATAMHEKIETAEANLILRLDPTIPKLDLAEDEFFQAVVAIMTNALQAMQSAATEDRQITLGTVAGVMDGLSQDEGKRGGNHLRNGDKVGILFVEDNGPGMSKANIESACDPFFTTKATGTGTGLGLSVARKIVELHGGILRLQNRDDGASGLRVSIYLKVKSKLITSV